MPCPRPGFELTKHWAACSGARELNHSATGPAPSCEVSLTQVYFCCSCFVVVIGLLLSGTVLFFDSILVKQGLILFSCFFLSSPHQPLRDIFTLQRAYFFPRMEAFKSATSCPVHIPGGRLWPSQKPII